MNDPEVTMSDVHTNTNIIAHQKALKAAGAAMWRAGTCVPAWVFQLEDPDAPKLHCPGVPPLTIFGPQEFPRRNFRAPKIVKDGTSAQHSRHRHADWGFPAGD